MALRLFLLLLLLLLLLLAWSSRLLSALILIVVVVALQQFLPEHLLPVVDILVQLVAVLADRELLVVIDRDSNAPLAVGLVVRRVELRDVRVG